ncbi:MAG: FG-GAP repeat domain-containing protein [Gaiellaceae bacterium]
MRSSARSGRLTTTALAALLAVALAAAARGEGLFDLSPPIVHPLERAGSLTVTDVNGDGRDDVLVTSQAGSSGAPASELHVYIQRPRGGLVQRAVHRLHGINANSLELGVGTGDVDGDGKVDAAVAVMQGVEVLLGRRIGFGKPTLVPLAGAFLASVGDVLGDSRAEVVVAVRGDPGSWGLFVVSHTAKGFRTRRVDSRLMHDIAIEDVNGDGRLDVVGLTDLGQERAGDIILLLGRRSGPFTRRTFPTPLRCEYELRSVTTGDVTGDGLVDVLAAGSGAIVVAQRAGGRFTAARPLPLRGSSVAHGDLNCDGRPDLVNASTYGFTNYRRLSAGNFGNFFYDFTGNAGDSPDLIGIGELNGDHRPDVAAATDRGLTIFVTAAARIPGRSRGTTSPSAGR